MLTQLQQIDSEAVISLEEARTHLNLTADESYHDDAVISARDSALSWLETYTGYSLQARQFRWDVNYFSSVMPLPRQPVLSDGVSAVEYYSTDGADTSLVSDQWRVGRGQLLSASGVTWPLADGSPGGVRITFTAGYATKADIPFNLIAAAKLAMGAFFRNRENPDLTGAMRVCDQIVAVF